MFIFRPRSFSSVSAWRYSSLLNSFSSRVRQVCGKIGVDLRVAQFLAQKALQHLDGIRRLRSHAAGIPLRPRERKLSALRAHLFRRGIWILRRRNALPQRTAGIVVINGRIFLLDHILLPLPEQFSPHSMPAAPLCAGCFFLLFLPEKEISKIAPRSLIFSHFSGKLHLFCIFVHFVAFATFHFLPQALS